MEHCASTPASLVWPTSSPCPAAEKSPGVEAPVLSASGAPWVTLHGHSCLGLCCPLVFRPRGPWGPRERLPHSAHNSTPYLDRRGPCAGPRALESLASHNHATGRERTCYTAQPTAPKGCRPDQLCPRSQTHYSKLLPHIFRPKKGNAAVSAGGLGHRRHSRRSRLGDAEAPGERKVRDHTRLPARRHQTPAYHGPRPNMPSAHFLASLHALIHDLRRTQRL